MGDTVQIVSQTDDFFIFSCQNVDAASVSLNGSMAANIIKAVFFKWEANNHINNKLENTLPTLSDIVLAPFFIGISCTNTLPRVPGAGKQDVSKITWKKKKPYHYLMAVGTKMQ